MKDKEGKVNPIAILSYISILVLIPLLIEKEDKFVRFHVRQGLVLLICEAITWLITWFPVIGWFIGSFAVIIWIILSILGIINVLTGKESPLPIIGKYAEKFKI